MGTITFNAASQMVALGSVLICQTLYMILVARALGPEDFGRFSFAWTFVQILLIGGDLGLHNTAIRKISVNLSESPRYSNLLLWLKVVLSFGLFGLVCLSAVLFALDGPTGWALFLFGIGMVFHSMSIAINTLYQAHGKLYLASLNIVLIFGIQLLIGGGVMYLGGRLIALAAVYPVAAGAALFANIGLFQVRFHRLRWGPAKGWFEYAKSSFPVGLANFFSASASRVAVTILGLMAGPFSAGIFSAALRITSATSNVPIGILSAVLPVMASHQTDRRPVRALFWKSLLLLFAVSVPIALLFFLISGPLIELIYGEEYKASALCLQILSWSVIPIFVGMAFCHVLLSQNRLVRRLPIVSGTVLLANLLLCVILISYFGAVGASIAILVTEIMLAAGYAVAARGYLAE